MDRSAGATNIGAWLRRHAVFSPERAALVFENDGPLSYERLERWACGLAHRLSEDHGVARGGRIAYLGFNTPGEIALLFACARLGAVLVPLNWRLAPRELAEILADCAPGLLFHDTHHREVAEKICAELDGCTPSPVEGGPETGDGPLDKEPRGRLGDPVLIVYTSGATGLPKGVVLSQRALLVNALNSLDMHDMRPGDKVLAALPLFHVGGLNIQLTPALFAGATVHLHAKFDAAAVLGAIARIRPDLMVLVPATMQALMAQPGWEAADLSSLRMLTTGSTVVPLDLIAAYEARGVSVVQVYGSTETCPIAAYQRPGEGRTNPRATGRAALLSQLRLCDEGGAQIVKPGCDGEIEVMGDHVMDGYWNTPEADGDAFHEGWLRTGDVGHFDEGGNLVFQGRRSHLIISGSENIYPAEIERALCAIDGVGEAAVTGLADEKWGEVPAAAVVRADPHLSERQIRRALDDTLARFKHPRQILFVDALPRNAMGKVVLAAVRDMLANAAR